MKNKIIALISIFILSLPNYAVAEEIAGLTEIGIVSAELLNKELEFDVIYGDRDAPVTITEYASLSCHHCKNFYEKVFLGLKKKYIDEGKVRLVYRHAPNNLPAIKAAMLVECAEKNKKKQKFIGALFKSQHEWAYVGSPEELEKNLRVVSKIGGINDETFEKCYKDDAMEKRIIELQLKARTELKVDSTPTVFVNDKKFFEERSVETFSSVIDALLKKAEEK